MDVALLLSVLVDPRQPGPTVLTLTARNTKWRRKVNNPNIYNFLSPALLHSLSTNNIKVQLFPPLNWVVSPVLTRTVVFQWQRHRAHRRPLQVLQVPGPGGQSCSTHTGSDAPSPGGLQHRPPRPGRAHLLPAEQPPEVVWDHDEMVQRTTTDIDRNNCSQL